MSLGVILGPMNSGKTTALLDEAARINAVGLKVLFVNSIRDTRSTEDVSTHNPILSFENKLHNVTFMKLSHLKGLDVSPFHSILIDEGQFYDDLRESVIEFIDIFKKNVRVAGLSGDYRRRPFGQMLDLIPLCEPTKVIFKTSYCTRCAREEGTLVDAPHSYRLNKEERAQIVPGGPKMYEPLCTKHFVGLSAQ